MGNTGAILLNCPRCGAGLEIYPDLAQFACGACGRALAVIRRGGTVALAPAEGARAGAGPDRAAADRALQRLPEELAAKRRDLEEKARTLQYLRHHLNDDPGGFEPEALVGLWPVLWRSALGTAVLALAVLADQHEGVPLRGLAVSLVAPLGLGLGIRALRNRRAVARNARLALAKREAVRANQVEVMKCIQAVQREHDEAARQVAELTGRLALAKAVAET